MTDLAPRASSLGRIGILGGTLDPIHCGHLAAAGATLDAFELPRLLVMPSHVPPHRSVQPVASPFHRFAMAALAVSGLARIEASDDELGVDGPSYSADTLQRLQARGYAASQIFFVTGADAFAEIATWKRYPAVLDLAHFVVVSRPGYDVGALAARLPALADRMRPAGTAPDAGRTSVFLLPAATPDVSSTRVRARVRSREPLTGLVPPLVETHIRQHRLYAAPAEHLHGQS
jgi:nicotinate-nucleotide adenylyltransferase